MLQMVSVLSPSAPTVRLHGRRSDSSFTPAFRVLAAILGSLLFLVSLSAPVHAQPADGKDGNAAYGDAEYGDPEYGNAAYGSHDAGSGLPGWAKPMRQKQRPSYENRPLEPPCPSGACDGTPPEVPVDGGLSLLVVAGASYALSRLSGASEGESQGPCV